MAENADLSLGLKIFVPFIGVKLMDESKHPLKDIPQKAISGLEIEEDLEEPGLFRIYLNDTLNLKTQKRSWAEDTNLQPENTVKISIGYVSDPANKLLSFIGRIRSVGTQAEEENSGTLELRGYDLSYDLKKTDSAGIIYNDKKYSDIVTEIAGNNKLKTDKIETSKLTYENIIRPPGESDFTFLKKVSEEIGFEAFVQEESLYFRKPKDTVKGQISFEPGKGILNFNPTMSTAVMVSELTVNSWDIKKKEMISGKATLNDIKSGVGTKEFSSAGNKLKKIKINLGSRVLRSAEEAKNVAISELKRRNKGFIKAELECIGNPALRPGMTINIEKVEQRFNGVYYIERAIHTVGKNGYKTTLSLRGCL
jgi:phage protein D